MYKRQVKKYLNTITAKLVEIKPSSNSDSNQEGFRVQMLSEASLGEVVWPILPLILGCGGLLGSIAGFGLGCLVELADKTFHNPDEVMKQLQVPLIGHIPVIGQGKRYLVEGSAIEPTSVLIIVRNLKPPKLSGPCGPRCTSILRGNNTL